MKTKIEKTWWAKIYISGALPIVEHACRKEFLSNGLCVTVTPTKFIYKGGEETGVEVGLVNYPKFPSSRKEIKERALSLANILVEATCQESVLVMTPEETIWMTERN